MTPKHERIIVNVYRPGAIPGLTAPVGGFFVYGMTVEDAMLPEGQTALHGILATRGYPPEEYIYTTEHPPYTLPRRTTAIVAASERKSAVFV